MKTVFALAFAGILCGSVLGCAHKAAAKTDTQPAATQPAATEPAPAQPQSEPVPQPPPN